MLLRGSNAVPLTGQDVKVFAFVYHPLQSGYVGRINMPRVFQQLKAPLAVALLAPLDVQHVDFA